MISVDVIGLPAAGKSTLSAKLYDGLHSRGAHVLSRMQAESLCLRRRDVGLLKSVFKYLPPFLRDPVIGIQHALGEWHAFATRHVPLLSLVYEVLGREGVSPSFRDCLIYGFMQHGIQHELFRQYLMPDECVLWDEGFVHRGFTLLGYLPPDMVSDDDIERYITAMPSPSFVVWAYSELDVIMRRLEARVRVGIERPILLEHVTELRQRNQLHHGLTCMQRMVGLIESRGIPVITVETSNCADPAVLMSAAERIAELFPL